MNDITYILNYLKIPYIIEYNNVFINQRWWCFSEKGMIYWRVNVGYSFLGLIERHFKEKLKL